MRQKYHIRVVLVRSLYSRNLGAVSRAMSNMGVTQLILIDPKVTVDFEAKQAAASGQEALENLVIFKNWNEFNQAYPLVTRIAFSARDGENRILQPFDVLLSDLHKGLSPYNEIDEGQVGDDRKTDKTLELAFVFGPEDAGLTNQDLENCHLLAWLPIYGNNTSFNLSQAVLLALFMVRYQWEAKGYLFEQRGPESRLDLDQKKGDYDWFPDTSFKKFLTALQFDIEDRKVSIFSTMKQLFLRTRPTDKEKRLLAAIFEQAARKLNGLRSDFGDD